MKDKSKNGKENWYGKEIIPKQETSEDELKGEDLKK